MGDGVVGAVGVVGLGTMGSAIAGNLLRAGFAVVGHDVAAARVEQHVAAGGQAAASSAEVAARAPVVITSLPSAAALGEVVAGADGLATGLANEGRRDLVVVEASTLPIAAKEHARNLLAGQGCTLLDCPLSGTGAQARVGDLVVLGSGDPAALRRCEPVFRAFARSWYDLGAFGNGSKVKFLANLLVAVHNLAAAEALSLARRAGLDLAVVLPVLADGAGTSRMLELRGPLMVTGDYGDAAMRVELWLKDVGLIGAFAREHGAPTPLFDAAAPYYHAALAQGRGAQDTACVLAVLEQLSAAQAQAPAQQEG